MRIIVCGSRNWTSKKYIMSVLQSLPPNTVVIEGECRGADLLARETAEELGFTVESYPADCNRWGKKAGPMRNCEMLNSGVDMVIAFHHDLSKSKGTKHMVGIAEQADIMVLVFPKRT